MTVFFSFPLIYSIFRSGVALRGGPVTGAGAANRFSAVSSRELALALPLSVICPAAMIRTIAAARPIAMFLRSVVRSPKAVLSFSVCMCMAATMLLPTPYSHLEGFGTLPIGRDFSRSADKQSSWRRKIGFSALRGRVRPIMFGKITA